jgi:hypothetical protein
MSHRQFDVTSKLADVANALHESESRQTQLKAQLQEEEEYSRHLLAILSERFSTGFPGLTGEEALRKIEANVRRSVSRVVADKKKQGRGREEARIAAIDKAHIVADRYGLSDLTDGILKHVDQTVKKAYGTKTQSLAVKLRAR